MRVTICRKCHNRRCTCKKSTGAFATETVNKVITIPVQGEPGLDGDKLVSYITELEAKLDQVITK